MSEKDAHLAWLEATSEGNIHTRSTIDRLRKERRDLLLRMKEEVRHAELQCLSRCIKQFYFRMRTVESLCPSWRRAPAPCSRAPSRSPPWAPSGSITWVLCLISSGAMMRFRFIERGGWCRRSHDRVHQRWQWWRPPRLPPGHQLPPASRADLAPGGWHGLGEQLLRPTASLASLPAATQLTTPCLCPLWHSSFVQTLCQYPCVMSFRF